MYEKIKQLFPDIQDFEFSLRDDSDGSGVYIDKWDYAGAPKPSQADLEAVVIKAIPQVVSRFQAKAALARGGLLANVEALMSNPETPIETRLAWQDAQEFRRYSPTVLSMGAALGLSETDLDNLFTVASGIEA